MTMRRSSARVLGAALLCAALLAGCGTTPGGDRATDATGPSETATRTAPPVGPAPVGDVFDRARWPLACDGTGRILELLTVRQKVGQLLGVGVTGEADARAAIEAGVAGIFVGSGSDPALLGAPRLPDLPFASGLPLHVSIDEEGGRVQRAASLVGAIPSARQMAATMTEDQVRALAAEHGKKLRERGVTIDLAPVLDLDGGSAGTVVGDRSFSADPAVAWRYAAAFAEGLREAGVMPVFKHFPGHGRTGGDSHLGSVTTPPLQDLVGHELVPYREAVRVPGAGIMVGHFTVPGLTEEGLPTSLSPAAYRLLREGAGYGADPFDGVIFTDDLGGMQAVTDHFTVPQAVLAAIRAGADVALWISTATLPDVIETLVAAVESGELPISRVDESIGRTLRMRGVVRC